MKRVAAAILHDDDMAADAVQETLMRLWHRRWRLSMMKDYKGYSIKALRNQCLDMMRHQKLDFHNAIPLDSTDIIPQTGDDTGSAEERYRIIDEAISKLPQQQQQLIELKYVRQHSIREIAELTGLSETNITTSLSRAYAILRKSIVNSDP